ncbi:MAG: methyltransferase domain-containing protein [Planctomycetes bacterium]|nr:methyltransferase domain-containing protein [Planctomycetota bacterium]
MDELQANRAYWDERAHLHATVASNYRVEAFRRGEYGWERNVPDDLGDVRGLKLLHLQCHFGMDSMLWARQGAVVTGVDFSEQAIAHARALSAEVGVAADFVCCPLHELPAHLQGEFDLVLNYHGVLPWLPDLGAWARVIAHFLKPGGYFYLCDTHPFAQMLDVAEDGSRLEFRTTYFPNGKPERYVVNGSYSLTDVNTRNNVAYEWNHSLGEIVNGLLGAGLRLEYLHEFPYTFWNAYKGAQGSLMKHREADWWHLKDGDRIPLMFSLKAVKPGGR